MSTKHNIGAKKFEHLYFVPGEVILHVEYRSKKDPAIDKQMVWNAINDLIGSVDDIPWTRLRWIPEFKSLDPILHFPRLKIGNYVLALVPLEIKNQKATLTEYVDLLEDIYEVISAKEDGYRIKEDITVKYVSPNWFAGAGHHQGSSGGPGGPPRQASPPTEQRYIFNQRIKDKLSDNELARDVHIAVLDTAPSKADFKKGNSNGWYTYHLLNSWLNQFKNIVDYAAEDKIRKVSLDGLENFYLLNQHYEMPDHGLFVSDIIHTMSEEAILHVYEVLNRFGLGTYYSVAQALSKVLNDISETPLIINCSLVFDYPRGGHSVFNFPLNSYSELFRHTAQSMNTLFTRIAELDQVLVIAAAGNDRWVEKIPSNNPPKPGSNERPDARYPAAFVKTIGVGALSTDAPLDYEPASYSNLADEPAGSGYLVFGGDSFPNEGLLGVFLGRFPKVASPVKPTTNIEYSINSTGWARWYGTSFATAQVSGLVAAWWRNHASQSTAKAIGFLDSTQIITISGTREKVIQLF